MCLEKPSFTERPIRPVRERIDLLKQDTSLTSREMIKEIIRIEVRGGRGNSKLIGWTHGSIEDKASAKINKYREILREDPLYDYKYGTKPLDVWSNIESGRDIYKLTEKQKNDLRITLSMFFSMITMLLIFLIL